MKKITLIIVLFLSFCICFSQPPQGPNNPSTTGTDTSVGTLAWNNGNNVFTSDGVKANTGNMVNGDVTNFLTVTNFGFTIPAGAIIDGIEVSIERDDNNGVKGIKDNIIQLIQGGVISGDDLSSNQAWPDNSTSKN